MAEDQNNARREVYTRLAQTGRALKDGDKVEPVTVRELLQWFGAERRNDKTNFEISEMLRYLDLRTEPWFEDQFIDGPLVFQESYFGGSHVPTETEKMVIDVVEEHFQKEGTKTREPLKRGEASYLNNLWWRLVKRRVEAWIGECPTERSTQEQVQAKVNEFVGCGLDLFSEGEIKEEIYFMNQDLTEAESENVEPHRDTRHPLPQVERLLQPIRATDMPGAAKIIPFPSQRPAARAVIAETTFRIRRFESANRPPVHIEPNRSIIEAITIMSLRDFSQLPVMSGEREVKGMVSFKSILECFTRGADLSGEVREYMDTPAFEINIDTPLLDAIGEIVRSQYALIRDKGKITGIVTVSDLSEQFRQLSEPFLVVRQIENHLRALIHDRIPGDKLNDLKTFADFQQARGKVDSVFDLDFGDYLRLLRDSENWDKLELRIDKGVFNRELDRIREIRNDVMHFDPDGITPVQLKTLQEFAKLLRMLEGRRG
jgi:CBS domain-containing protein